MFHRKRTMVSVALIIMCIPFVVQWIEVAVFSEKFYRLTERQSSSMLKFEDNHYSLDDWQCSQKDLLRRIEIFKTIISKDISWSSCYTSNYVEKLYLADMNHPHHQQKLFFDVGADKGYTIALWLSI